MKKFIHNTQHYTHTCIFIIICLCINSIFNSPIFSLLLPCCGTQITHKSNRTEVARKHSRPARRCLIEYRWNSRSNTSFGNETSDEIAVCSVVLFSWPSPSLLPPLSLASAHPLPFAFFLSVAAFILRKLYTSLCVDSVFYVIFIFFFFRLSPVIALFPFRRMLSSVLVCLCVAPSPPLSLRFIYSLQEHDSRRLSFFLSCGSSNFCVNHKL